MAVANGGMGMAVAVDAGGVGEPELLDAPPPRTWCVRGGWGLGGEGGDAGWGGVGWGGDEE